MTGNIIFARRLFGCWIFSQNIQTKKDKAVVLNPCTYSVIAYDKNGLATAIFGAGSENDMLTELKFELIETGCGAFSLTFSRLPTQAELNYRQRVDIHLFGDTQPWFSGYIITRPIHGTTENSYEFEGHGYYNLLEKVLIFKTYENMEVSAIAMDIVRIIETKTGLPVRTDKIVATDYIISNIKFDGVTAKEALEELAEFAIDYVFGIDEYRHAYFKPRYTAINEEARFWVGEHIGEYVPKWDVEKIVNWARIKGGTVNTDGEQWLAVVEDTESQEIYGIQEKVWTLPTAYSEGDAQRWGDNQIAQYKAPIKSAKIKGVRLAYPQADGSFAVRHLNTDGQALINTLDGEAVVYPITKIKYTLTPSKGLACEMELGEQPFTIDRYLAGLERDHKNSELLQAAATKQLKG